MRWPECHFPRRSPRFACRSTSTFPSGSSCGCGLAGCVAAAPLRHRVALRILHCPPLNVDSASSAQWSDPPSTSTSRTPQRFLLGCAATGGFQPGAIIGRAFQRGHSRIPRSHPVEPSASRTTGTSPLLRLDPTRIRDAPSSLVNHFRRWISLPISLMFTLCCTILRMLHYAACPKGRKAYFS